MAQRHNLAIILVRHLNKSKSDTTEYRGAGSVGIIGAARSGLQIEDHPSEDPYHHQITVIKSNLSDAPPQPYRTIKHDDGVISLEWLPLRIPTHKAIFPTARKTSRLQEAVDFLFVLLGNGPIRTTEILKIARESDVSETTLRRAKSDAGIVHWKRSSDGSMATFWELPLNRVQTSEVVLNKLRTMLETSTVADSGLSPYIATEKDQLVVVTSHRGGGQNLFIHVERNESGGSSRIVADNDENRVCVCLAASNAFSEFRSKLADFELHWDEAITNEGPVDL